jgi:hypothetical protein
MSSIQSDAFQPHRARPKLVAEEGINDMLTPEEAAPVTDEKPGDFGNFAYELLLLQQRLAAYERLHQEEMAELHQEIERLRRVFLLETNPHMRAIVPPRHTQRSTTEVEDED